MVERVLFVDLENVHKVGLAEVPADARVMIFYGAGQKSLPAELVVQAQPLGARLTWIRICGKGPNALDFHIAFYIGRELAANAASECIVLSNDTGFDPLMQHLAARGHVCRRVTDVSRAFLQTTTPPEEAPPAPPPSPAAAQKPPPPLVDEPFKRLLALLKNGKARPGRSKGLAATVKCWFPRLRETERLALMQRLFSEAWVQQSGKSLTYHL